MNVFKVAVRFSWGSWSDFRFVTAPNKKAAIINALQEIDVPEMNKNDRLLITAYQESPFPKKKGK